MPASAHYRVVVVDDERSIPFTLEALLRRDCDEPHLALAQTHGTEKMAAVVLGIHRPTLGSMMGRYGIARS